MQHYTRHREKQIAANIRQAFNTMECIGQVMEAIGNATLNYISIGFMATSVSRGPLPFTQKKKLGALGIVSLRFDF